MPRFTMPLTLGLLACALVCAPAGADDPPKKLTPEERKKLEAKLDELTASGINAYRAGKYPSAIEAFEGALKVARESYPKTEFPDGHEALAAAMNNLAVMYQALGKYGAAESLLKEALGMLRRLFKADNTSVAMTLNSLANLYQVLGKYEDAEPLYKEALGVRRRLFKGDHPDVAAILSDLAGLYNAQGKATAAEPLLKDALDMRRRLFKGDHPVVAATMNNLAILHLAGGKYAAAEPLLKDALDMRRRLFKGDHPDVAANLHNLGSLYYAQGKPAVAEPLLKEALDMRRRLFKGDHPIVALNLNSLADVYRERGKYGTAESLLKEALDMRRRLFKDGHPIVTSNLNSLADLYQVLGEYEAAEPLYKEALVTLRRLFKGDYRDIAATLHNLGVLYYAQGKPAAAEPLLKEALDVYRRLITRFAQEKSEGEALTIFSSLPQVRDVFLSSGWGRGADPSAVYPLVWLEKGFIGRVYENRHQQARAVTNPKAAKALAELTDARRRRAELLFVPAIKDQATLDKRKADIENHDKLIEERTGELKLLLPAIERADTLATAQLAELQKALPADTTVIDFLYSVHFEQDPKTPGKAGETRTPRYLAFVVTKDKVAWVDLGTAATVELAVDAWRDAITGGKDIPDAMPAKVRELVWEKVRKELPAGTTTVYVCPDAALCRLPFAALPGDKPNTVLLDDYAIATIPHAPFLLDKLWPQDKPTSKPTGALVVGGVKYDAAVAPVAKDAPAPGPLVKPDAKLVWKALPNTVGEAKGVAGAAERKKLAPTRLDGDQATTAAVLAALPKAKVAHFATHGFFADPSFRGVFNLDPKDFEMRGGERVGRAVNSPLVMTGLVFAGANDPKAPGRGIVTGEQLIDLDLSGLELAVLSACETGLGDVADGQGVFGLQRAFHYAGATNVVCSLWKVPDEPTAALMGAFYANLWDKGLSPMESLRQAQLEVYRNPGKIPALAKGFRGVFEEVDAPKVEAKAAKDGTAHPLLWAAFTLSGPGK